MPTLTLIHEGFSWRFSSETVTHCTFSQNSLCWLAVRSPATTLNSDCLKQRHLFVSRVRRNSKASEDVEYPAYGVTGPAGKDISPTSGADRKLAQNAQMYHYQHQKQQMIAFDR